MFTNPIGYLRRRWISDCQIAKLVIASLGEGVGSNPTLALMLVLWRVALYFVMELWDLQSQLTF